jgi:hypothetical protein
VAIALALEATTGGFLRLRGAGAKARAADQAGECGVVNLLHFLADRNDAYLLVWQPLSNLTLAELAELAGRAQRAEQVGRVDAVLEQVQKLRPPSSAAALRPRS